MPPHFVLVLLGCGAFALSVYALRGLLEIREALRLAELDRLASPEHWQVTRAGAGMAAGLLVLFAAKPLGAAAWLAAGVAAALGYAVAPRFLASARRRVELELLDDLPLHLDLMALSLEAGSTLPAALAHCAEHAPEGALRRAWMRIIMEIHGGMEVHDALRGLEQRTGVRAFGLLVHGLRAAEKFNMSPARLVRERARQAAAQHFARAEQRARAAPLKLWATLVLCLAPCTLVVLAYPMARMLAQIVP